VRVAVTWSAFGSFGAGHGGCVAEHGHRVVGVLGMLEPVGDGSVPNRRSTLVGRGVVDAGRGDGAVVTSGRGAGFNLARLTVFSRGEGWPSRDP